MFDKLVTLALLGLFPFAWQAPLAKLEHLLYAEDFSVLSGIIDLFQEDAFLAVLLFVFAVIFPYSKLLLTAYIQVSENPARWRLVPLLHFLSKWAMLDVFFVALVIAVYRGVISDLNIKWGMYLFSSLVLVSLFVSWRFERRLRRREVG